MHRLPLGVMHLLFCCKIRKEMLPKFCQPVLSTDVQPPSNSLEYNMTKYHAINLQPYSWEECCTIIMIFYTSTVFLN